ncbi:MAG: hypothetical protein KAH24_01210 [Holophagae bacterium]|nr:hypothetical protein [Holophagae bacterium]
MDEKRFPKIIKNLYKNVAELEKMFPGRPFTPDGHMVGSIGECIAEHYYNLKLVPPSNKGYDAVKGKLKIEIKATQAKSIGLRSKPQHLLVLKIHKDGSFSEIYNGRGNRVWDLVSSKPLPSNGQYQISTTRLKELMKTEPKQYRV